MEKNKKIFEDYFSHLKSISFLGHIYKKYFASPLIYHFASRFGSQIMEVGSGTGSGVLGAFPKQVSGLDINPAAVEYSRSLGLRVQLINADGIFPVADGTIDVCILDNVLEHIEEPKQTLNECHRVTVETGGLVVVVPGISGYESDQDHKKFYDENDLKNLDERWTLIKLIAMPFYIKNIFISKNIRQYCLMAIYKKSEKV
jgi:SAM-dependent methyltransferase